jgi:hypothetical protein
MEAINEAQQVQITGVWRVLDAMANTGRPREPYTTLVLFAFGRALARKRHPAVFQWALRSARELEQLLS